MISPPRQEDPRQPNDARGSVARIDNVSRLADRGRTGARKRLGDEG